MGVGRERGREEGKEGWWIEGMERGEMSGSEGRGRGSEGRVVGVRNGVRGVANERVEQ